MAPGSLAFRAILRGMARSNPPEPLRILNDGSPCWCVDELTSGHTSRCTTHRAFAGTKGQPAWLQASSRAHTTALQASFLAHYARLGIITAAAEAAGINRGTVLSWRKGDSDFKQRMDDAQEEAADVVEREVYRRAVEGWDEPVFQGGNEVGSVRKFSDTILALHVKAVRPAKYRENIRAEISGPDGGSLIMTVLPAMEDHERAALRKVLEDAIRASTEADADAGGVSAATPVSENVG